MESESDIDAYRQPWESDEHWDLRKTFIMEYHGKFEEDRLLSLSQVYFNVEILGCSYSADVMSQINKLAEGLPASKRPKKKEQVAFVPESSDRKYKVAQRTPEVEKVNYDHYQNRQTAASFFSTEQNN